MEEIEIREGEEFIKLGQALKKAGIAESGVDAKFMIEDGLVNGDMFAYVELKGKIDEEMKKVSMAFDFFKKEQ